MWQANYHTTAPAPNLLLTNKIQDFPGHPRKICQDLFGAHKLIYTEKTRSKGGKIHQHSTLYLSKQQSTQTGCYTIAACFPFEPLEKCMNFKDTFPGLSRTLSFNFQGFPGLSRSWNFQWKNPGLSRRCGHPVTLLYTGVASVFHESISVLDRWRAATKNCSDGRPVGTKLHTQPRHRHTSASVPPTTSRSITHVWCTRCGKIK